MAVVSIHGHTSSCFELTRTHRQAQLTACESVLLLLQLRCTTDFEHEEKSRSAATALAMLMRVWLGLQLSYQTPTVL